MKLHNKYFLPIVLTLAVLIFFFFLLAGLYRFDNKYTAGPPYGENGVFAFSEADLDRPLFLVDGWELNGQEVFIGQYSNFSYLPGGESPFGEGTYRLALRYDGPPTALILEIPEIYTEYTLYVNGEAVSSRRSASGSSQTADSSAGSAAPHILGGANSAFSTAVVVPVGNGDTLLVLDTENQTHYYSGLTYPPAIGTAAVMNRLFFVRTLFYAVLCIASLTLALFSLVLWLARTRDPLFRHFGALCLAFALGCAHPFVWQLGGSGPFWYALEDSSRLLMLAQAASLAAITTGLEERRWYRRLVRPITLGAAALCFLTVLLIIPNAGALVNFYGGIVDWYKLSVWAYLAVCAGIGLSRGESRTSFFVLSACGVLGISLLAGLWDSNLFEPIYTGWQSEYAGFLLVLLFGGLMVRRNAELLRQSAELQSVRLQNRFAAESAAQLRASIDQVRGLKHDLRHHVDTMERLCAAGDYSRLSAYLAELNETKEALPPLYYAENFLVNAILSGHLGPAREKKIRVECSASVPETLPVADSDLCTLLANLLSNAVEACERLPEGADRFISLSLSIRKNLFLIQSANSAPPKNDGASVFATSKADADSHGLGIPAMRRIVEKYDGALEMHQENGVFTLRAVLNLSSAEIHGSSHPSV